MSAPPLKATLAILVLQNLLLVGGLCWILLAPHNGLTGRSLGRGSPAPASAGAASGGDRVTVPVYDEESLAVRDYLRHLDELMSLETILTHRPDLDEVVRLRSAARQCTRFNCPALDEWSKLVKINGGKIPAAVRWRGSGKGLAQSMALGEYVDLLQSQVEDVSAATGRADLALPTALFDQARACGSADCPALATLQEQVAFVLASVGRTLPPTPVIGDDDGNDAPLGRTAERAPSRRKSKSSRP